MFCAPMNARPFSTRTENDNAPAARTVPLRAEIPAADTWDLTALYPDVAAWQADFEAVRADYPRLPDFKGKLGRAAQDLLAALEFEKALGLKIERLYSYASLQNSEDGSNADSSRAWRSSHNLLTRIGEASAFMAPEIQAIPDETFAGFLADPALGPWKTRLEESAPLQAAHPLRSGGTPARPRRRRAGGAPGNVRAVDERGHEVRHDPRRKRPRGRALAKLLFVVPQQARPGVAQGGVPPVLPGVRATTSSRWRRR